MWQWCAESRQGSTRPTRRRSATPRGSRSGWSFQGTSGDAHHALNSLDLFDLIVFYAAFLGESLGLPWKWKGRLSPRNMKVNYSIFSMVSWLTLNTFSKSLDYNHLLNVLQVASRGSTTLHSLPLERSKKRGNIFTRLLKKFLQEIKLLYILRRHIWNVLECRIVKSNAVYNIYAWSNHSDLHTCIIMIKPSVKVPNLSYRVVYDKYIAKYLMFVEAPNIVQSLFEMLVKRYWMVCLKELNKD